MIGPILNMLNDAYVESGIINSSSAFNKDSNIFGTGTQNVTVDTNMTAEDLYNKYGTLEFKDLTISYNVALRPKRQEAPPQSWNVYSVKNNFHPFVLKCSGTLRVDGALTTQGCGGTSVIAGERDRTFYQNIQSPIELYNVFGDGFSADYRNFLRLYAFGQTGGFLTYPETIFLTGGGGGGVRYYKKHYKARKRRLRQYGFVCGGKGENGDAYHSDNVFEGTAAGFLAMYFRKLYINGKEYGKEPCNITKISANGYICRDGDYLYPEASKLVGYTFFWNTPIYDNVIIPHTGAGCMIIAADTIDIGATGTINADSYGGITSYKVNRISGGSYTASRGHGGVIKPSFLNNFPCLCDIQSGMRWDPTTNRYIIATGSSGTYYFDDGTGFGTPNCYMTCQGTRTIGGAGIALGFKVGD